MSGAVAVTTDQHLLGEGARWDGRRNELLRVDIMAGRVHRDLVAPDGSLVPAGDYDVPGTVGAITPVDGDEGWLLAANRGFAHLSADGSLRPLADIIPEGNRMNDAASDPQGRFWAGSKADDNRAGAAALYRFDGVGQVELMLGGLTISNGLGWSPDGATMYLADSIPGTVHAFAFDGEHGAISDERVIIDLRDDEGAPGRPPRSVRTPPGGRPSPHEATARSTTSSVAVARGRHGREWQPLQRSPVRSRHCPATVVPFGGESGRLGRTA